MRRSASGVARPGVAGRDAAIDCWLVAALAVSAPRSVPRRRGARARLAAPDGVCCRRCARTLEIAQDAALDALDAEDVATHDALDLAVGRSGGPRDPSRVASRRRWRPAVAAEEVGDDHAVASASTAFLASLLRPAGSGDRDAAAAQRSRSSARPRASGLIRRCLHADDVETRAQAIEALRRWVTDVVSRAVVRLLDSEPEPTDGPDPTSTPLPAVCSRTGTAGSAPAIRTLAAHLAGGAARGRGAGLDRSGTRRALGGGRHPARREPDARDGGDARRAGADAVPARVRCSSTSRRRISSASPRPRSSASIAAGEALVREGDVGDELIVIVEGSVEVVRDIDAEHRVLRRYQKGDHIGELAVLREGTRAATVVAGTPASGSGPGGDAVKAILRERPEAAMAMLGPLADADQHEHHEDRPGTAPRCRPARSRSCGPTSKGRCAWCASSAQRYDALQRRTHWR